MNSLEADPSHHGQLLHEVQYIWETELATDALTALDNWNALISEHGAQAVGAALAAVRRRVSLPDPLPSPPQACRSPGPRAPSAIAGDGAACHCGQVEHPLASRAGSCSWCSSPA